MRKTLFTSLSTLLIVSLLSCLKPSNSATIIEQDNILSHVVDLENQDLRFFLKNENGEHYKSFENLSLELKVKQQNLVFAMNGGIYQENLMPLGLYIENGKALKNINRVQEAFGNFYLQPNGIFYITNKNKAFVTATKFFESSNEVKYATQSGPMLLIEGEYHPAFNEGSPNEKIRNGVGVLPNGSLLFALSKEVINFYDFATFFKKNGCKNALYLDGTVSRAYLPSKNWEQLGGNFGVIIGEVE